MAGFARGAGTARGALTATVNSIALTAIAFVRSRLGGLLAGRTSVAGRARAVTRAALDTSSFELEIDARYFSVARARPTLSRAMPRESVSRAKPRNIVSLAR
jgi:hypothetical protein